VGLTVTSVDEGNLTSCKVNQLGPLQTARKQRSYIGSSWTAPKAWMDADFLCTFLLAPLCSTELVPFNGAGITLG